MIRDDGGSTTTETSVDNHFTRQYIPEDNSEQHTQSLIRNSENRKAPKTESFFMEVASNLNTTVTITTMTTLMYPLLQDPQARCNVPLLLVYVQEYNSVRAGLCLKFYWMFYLEIKSTIAMLWSVFIPLKISNAINNIYQLVLISCAILSLSAWPLIPLTTILKSEKFRFPKGFG
jgi:hypothetical protein